MRLPLIEPNDLDGVQKPLYENMRAGISASFNAFRTETRSGALIGPWNPLLHEPAMGKAMWDLIEAVAARPTLPRAVREIAILAVGARYKAAYELYAHIAVAESVGIGVKRLSALCSGTRPDDLDDAEKVAYDVAHALAEGGVLPEPCYRLAVETFGQHGLNELVYLVGTYCAVSVLLNAYDVPIPEEF